MLSYSDSLPSSCARRVGHSYVEDDVLAFAMSDKPVAEITYRGKSAMTVYAVVKYYLNLAEIEGVGVTRQGDHVYLFKED